LQHGCGLIVSSGTVLDGQNEHHAVLFPNVANSPVIANPITPQPTKLMTQGLPEAARFFFRGNPGVHVVENFPLHFPVNDLQVFFNPCVVFNRPRVEGQRGVLALCDDRPRPLDNAQQ
jgi:hypothetical protein